MTGDEKGLQKLKEPKEELRSAHGGRRLAVSRRDQVDFYDYRSHHMAVGFAMGIPNMADALGTKDPVDEAFAYVAWSPRNNSTGAEGPWEDWVTLARAILPFNFTPPAGVPLVDLLLEQAIENPPERGYRVNNVFIENHDGWWVGDGAYGTWEEWEQLAKLILRIEKEEPR